MSTTRRGCGGLSLVELIVFIVLVSVAVAGVLGALNFANRASTDPMIQKQALAIAEALLEEAQLQPFTFCDPDDANAATATDAKLNSGVVAPRVGCANTVEAMGAEPGGAPPGILAEARFDSGTTSAFDNVNDYNGFSMVGATNVAGGAGPPELSAYAASVTVAPQTLGGIALDANGQPQSLLITVTVTGPGNTTVRLDGYRIRYAPNALP